MGAVEWGTGNVSGSCQQGKDLFPLVEIRPAPTMMSQQHHCLPWALQVQRSVLERAFPCSIHDAEEVTSVLWLGPYSHCPPDKGTHLYFTHMLSAKQDCITAKATMHTLFRSLNEEKKLKAPAEIGSLLQADKNKAKEHLSFPPGFSSS